MSAENSITDSREIAAIFEADQVADDMVRIRSGEISSQILHAIWESVLPTSRLAHYVVSE